MAAYLTIFSHLESRRLGVLISFGLAFSLSNLLVTLLPAERFTAVIVQRAILITILLTQVYAFYQDQFIALSGLLINVVILITLRYMIDQEEEKTTTTAEGVLSPAG